MNLYLSLKLVHVLSATILFGTGIGTAFFMLKAYLSKSDVVMLETCKHVIQADWFFTTPAVVVQLVTGLWLVDLLSIPLTSPWFMTVIGLYVFIGACWLPVVWIQIRIHRMLSNGASRDAYRPLMRIWIALGIPAFLSILIIFYLMISKAGAYT